MHSEQQKTLQQQPQPQSFTSQQPQRPVSQFDDIRLARFDPALTAGEAAARQCRVAGRWRRAQGATLCV